MWFCVVSGDLFHSVWACGLVMTRYFSRLLFGKSKDMQVFFLVFLPGCFHCFFSRVFKVFLLFPRGFMFF